VHRDGVDAERAELLDEPVGAALGADEDECEVALGAQLLDQRLDPVVALDRAEAVLDVCGALLGWCSCRAASRV
jgi:hypothetical protein